MTPASIAAPADFAMPPQRTFLKTAPADLHPLHAGGTLVLQCRPGDSTARLRRSSEDAVFDEVGLSEISSTKMLFLELVDLHS